MADGPLFERVQRAARDRVAPGLTVEARPEGLYLPLVDLYLDPHSTVPRAFLSHAHADHAAAARPEPGGAAPDPSRLCFASRETAALLRARYGENAVVSELAWGEWMDLGRARVRVAGAGHVLGAAGLVLESDEGTLIYTGDTKPGAGLTHPAAELPPCDVLIVESTFGLPIFAFPSDAENHASMVTFAKECLGAGETPVFLAYALGKGQEIAQLLGSHGVPVRAHGAMSKLNEAYRALGVALPNVRPYLKEDTGEPGAIIVPPRERFGAMFKGTKGSKARVAYVSGWALFDASRERYDADLQVPLSDHASFAELDHIVRGCAPKRVYVTHGYSEAYARHLRGLGLDARAVEAAGYEA